MESSRSAHSSVGVGASTSNEPTVVRIKTTTRNKELFQHFDLCEMSNGVDKARCKGCGIFLKPESNSTLRSHLTKHCVVVKNNPANAQAQMSQECEVWNFDPDMVREMMGNLVIQESLPFNHFDNPRLTKMIQKALQPPSESAFSHSGRVLSIRRTRLTPASLEMCICLKDHLDAMERVQDQTQLEGELEIEMTIHDVEVEEGMMFPLSDEEQAMDEWMRNNSPELQSEAPSED
ncbi:hypothetical protein E3N88_29016 [Mikania micrantha]|uniref:HAT C-terminal dimerisation domain-containing protein n=1 Tax=Mikania micrantha TaxID=192012 RepID=A0A5N6N3Y8_9ASTR|nr:hypothetical protein E3N88_29016 [Mikania micrantha]